MATATLHGAKTYCYGGLVFTENEPVVVDNKVAEALVRLPQYFTVAFEGRKVAARQTLRPESPDEPTVSI